MDERRADRIGWRKKDSIEIPGNYQHRALTEGFVVQRFWHARKLDLVRRVAPPVPGGRALDVGCGSGVVASFLAEQGAIVDAVDSNAEAIEFAKRQFAKDDLCFHLAPANELAFPDGSFQRIYCLEVIEHLAADQGVELLRTLRRLLAPNGQILLTTPNDGGLWPVIERMMDALRLAPRMKGEQHVTRYRLRQLRAVAASAGLETQRCGRFCGLAPFASVLSWRLAEWLDRLGWRLGHPFGNLLYLCAGKTKFGH